MTAQEIYDHGVRSLPAIERLRLARMILDELRTSRQAQDELGEVWAEEIRKTTLPNEQLLQLAQTRVPPQSWWDETDDPFAPDQGK